MRIGSGDPPGGRMGATREVGSVRLTEFTTGGVTERPLPGEKRVKFNLTEPQNDGGRNGGEQIIHALAGTSGRNCF